MKVYNISAVLALITIYLVILAGGIVRGTGSGMGCPDWPKCFGNYIPPTSADELPEDYLDYFVEQRKEKNIRMAKAMTFFGFDGFAERLKADEQIYVHHEFNAFHTWTEYINRLVGALSGIFILIMALSGFLGRNVSSKKKLLGIVVLILVLLQGFLGAFVVSTNLIPFLISIHFALALAIIALLLMASPYSSPMGKNDQVFRGVALFTFIVLVVQFLGGTQVRENVDMLETNLVTAEILEELGSLYLFHRSFSLLILVGVLTLLWKGSRSVNKAFLPLCIFNLILVVLQISTGKILEVFDIPGAAQTIHVLISSLLFGSLFLLFLKTREPKKILSRINE